MKAVILAGGEGTRLRPLTCDLPKPLVPLCGKPVLFYILELLERSGCEEAAAAVRYKGEKIEAALGDGRYGRLRAFVSYEDKPLGTAGCVKKAAADFSEPLIVISGDAMCDFDLAAIYERHLRSGASATIAVRSVDDPREYGLILGEKGEVTGFSEKPSFINCRSDLANTGIYVISPEVFDLIENDRPVDFAKDVFPEMLRRGMKLGYYEESGYWCDIGDIAAYKRCTADLIAGRIRAQLPEREQLPKNCAVSPETFTAKGAYLSPKALAAGCTCIGSGVYVSDGAKLHNAIVMDGAFVGEGVTLNDCVICPDARIGAGAAVYEGAVVGEGAVIGENAVISGGVKIWNNKRIAKGAAVTADVKYGTASVPELSEDGMTGATNTVMTPGFAVRTGSAAAKISETGIAVSCSEGDAAVCLKNAVLCGISAAGKPAYDCGSEPLPVLTRAAGLLGADIMIYVSAKAQTKIMIYSAGMLPLRRTKERILHGAVSRGEYMTAGWDSFGGIKPFTGARQLYESALSALCGFTVPYDIRLVSRDPLIRTICTPFARQMSAGGQKMTVTVSERGDSAEISCGDTRIDPVTLTLLVCAAEARDGRAAALPFAFPRSAEAAAELYGGRILRYFESPMDDRDEDARSLARAQPYLRDGFACAVRALRLMKELGLTPAEAADSIPRSSTADRFVRVCCPPQRVLDRLKAVPEENEGAVISPDGERVFLRPDRRGTGIFMFAESFGTETAASLCDKAEAMILKAAGALSEKK
ncbi:MAG: NTP transferase domain-containing protein [Ruminiclostridium sp.]|nr:NTP transferase domain-containing protein [Ruminiclostridium sp.]